MDFHTCIGAGQKTVLINAQFVLVTANHVKGNLTDHKNQFESLVWVYFQCSGQNRNMSLVQYQEYHFYESSFQNDLQIVIIDTLVMTYELNSLFIHSVINI